MTDYLEPMTAEGDDALWEAEQRLAAALAGLREQLPKRAGKSAGEREDRPAEYAAADELHREMGLGSGRTAELAAGEGQSSARLPLLEALELLDPAAERGLDFAAEEGPDRASAPITRGWTRTEGKEAPEGSLYALSRNVSKYPEIEKGEQGYDSASPGSGRMTGVGETVQAERLDQVFRRDSRRYDGGFFLY